MADVKIRPGNTSPVEITFSPESSDDFKRMATESRERSGTVEGNGDNRFAKELRDRPDYEGALKTFQRFRKMVGNPAPSKAVPETTRGTWAKPDTDAMVCRRVTRH